MSLKLHTLVGCPFCDLALLAASQAGVEVETIIYTSKDKLKTPEYKAINPAGTVPSLETPEGAITESDAIVKFLARSGNAALLGGSNFQIAQVETAVIKGRAMLMDMVGVVKNLIGRYMPDAAASGKSLNALKGKIAALNTQLAGKTTLVGDSATIADVVLTAVLARAFTLVLSEGERKAFKNVAAYFDHQSTQEYFTRVFGNAGQRRLGKAKFRAPTVEQFCGWEGIPVPTKEAPKKKEKKAAAPKAAPKPAKKAGRDVPKSDQKLDDIKKRIINAEDMPAAIRELAKTYDSKAYSFWYGAYEKAKGEGEDFTRTANLLSNHHKDYLCVNKWTFGTWGIYGAEPSLEIRGVCFWNHPEFLTEFKDLPPGEYSKWRKLDMTKEEDVEKVVEFWTNRDDGQSAEGLPVERVKWVR